MKYNKHYIGLARDGLADNFVIFRARKEHLVTEFKLPRGEEVTAPIEDSGVDSLEYDKRWGHYRMRLTSKDLTDNRELLVELVRRASGTPAPPDDWTAPVPEIGATEERPL